MGPRCERMGPRTCVVPVASPHPKTPWERLANCMLPSSPAGKQGAPAVSPQHSHAEPSPQGSAAATTVALKWSRDTVTLRTTPAQL